MTRGEFEQAWRVSDDLLRRRIGVSSDHLPLHLRPVWNGLPLNGRRVLVRCHRGLGDTIQFIRYVPLVAGEAAEVNVLAQPELIPLLRGMTGMDRVLRASGDVVPDYDVDLEIMELAHVFRTTLETIPADVPYLHAEPARLPDDGLLRVGVVWRGGDWDGRRDVPFEELRRLLSLEGIAFYALQRELRPDERHSLLRPVNGVDTPLGTARVMSAIDLIVTIDSMPAHLAGALGRPVWTLLHSDPDWRWMRGREDSPWYPTMRLFRQKRPGRWRDVIDEVALALQTLRDGR